MEDQKRFNRYRVKSDDKNAKGIGSNIGGWQPKENLNKVNVPLDNLNRQRVFYSPNHKKI